MNKMDKPTNQAVCRNLKIKCTGLRFSVQAELLAKTLKKKTSQTWETKVTFVEKAGKKQSSGVSGQWSVRES